MSRYAAVNVRFGADISQFSTAMQNAARQMQRAGQQLQDVGKSLTMNLTAPILALGAASLYAFGEIDALKRGLISFTGSAELAEVEFSKLREVAKLPGIGLEEATRGSINLQAIGMSADEARKAMQAFGNAIATVGGGKENFDLAIRGFGQLTNASKPLQQDLYQIANQLPQVNKLMIEAFGTNRAEDLAAMGLSGKQLAEFLVDSLSKLPPITGGIKNSFENMSDTIKISLAGIGEAIDKNFNISGKLNAFADWIGDLSDKFKALDPNLQKFIIGALGIAAAIGPVMIGLGAILKILPLLRAGFMALNTAAPYLVAIGIAAVLIYENWEKVGKTIVDVYNYFVDLYDQSIIFRAAVEGQIMAFKNMFAGITLIVDLAINSVKAFGKVIAAVFSNAGQIIKAILTGDFAAVLPLTNKMAKEVFGAWGDGAKTFIDKAVDFGLQAGLNFTEGFDNATKGRKLEKMTFAAPEVKTTPTKTTNDNKGGSIGTNFDIIEMQPKGITEAFSKVASETELGWDAANAANEIGSQKYLKTYQDKFNAISDIINQGAANMAIGLAAAFGENLVDGDPFKDLGNILLSSLGNVMVQLGSEMVVFGGFLQAFKAALASLNPVVAVAAGLGMIAAGAAISKIAAKGMQSPTSGGGGGSYGGSSSGGNFTLETRLDGNDLVLSGQRTRYTRGR